MKKTSTEDMEAWAADAKRELAILTQLLAHPGATVAEVRAIWARAQALEDEAFARNTRNLAEMGRGLNQARDRYGEAFAELLRTHPDAVLKAARDRLDALEHPKK